MMLMEVSVWLPIASGTHPKRICLLDHAQIHCYGIVTWTGIDFILEPHTGIDGFHATRVEGIDVHQHVFIASVIFNLSEHAAVVDVARQRARVKISVHPIAHMLVACAR